MKQLERMLPKILLTLVFFHINKQIVAIVLENYGGLKRLLLLEEFGSAKHNIMNVHLILGSLSADHPWLQNAKKAPNVSLGETVRSRLKQFSVMNKLKKSALKVFFSKIYV